MIIGSILHGAYGDYYEQLVGIRSLLGTIPDAKAALFFADPHRMREMRVFDMSFAASLHHVSDLASVHVDRFHQYQVRDPELQQQVLRHLDAQLLGRLETDRQRLPWNDLRRAWQTSPGLCDLPLSPEGLQRLPDCMRDNGIDPHLFAQRPTIGFLWRYRVSGGAVSPRGQRPAGELLEVTSRSLRALIDRFDAHVLVCGMAVETTEENRHRIDRKFTTETLDLPAARVTYLQGLSWGLELEILRQCSACLLMSSGFSEALWLKRAGRGVVLHEPQLHYVLKLLRYRMPLFAPFEPANLLRYLRGHRSAEAIADQLGGILARTAPVPAAT